MAEYTTFTRAGLRGFDRAAQDLALEAMEMGWTGYMGTRGHLILRAPDGEATMSISQKTGNGRAGKNMRATFERWKRQQDPHVDEAVREIEVTSQIDRGNAAFLDLVRKNNPDHDGAVVLCRLALEDERVRAHLIETARHMDERKIRSFGDRVAMVWELPDGEQRAWKGRWLVYNPQTKTPVAWGGLRMRTIDDAYAMMREATALGGVIDPGADKPHVCADCGRAFRLPMHLARHRASKHPEFLGRHEDMTLTGGDVLPSLVVPEITPPDDDAATPAPEQGAAGQGAAGQSEPDEQSTLSEALTVLKAAGAAAEWVAREIERERSEVRRVGRALQAETRAHEETKVELLVAREALAAAEERAASNERAASDYAALREMLLSSKTGVDA